MGQIGVSREQVALMKHAIGYQPERVRDGKYLCFRNRFYCNEPDANWNYLVNLGLANKVNIKGSVIYSVNLSGIDYLEDMLDVEIEEQE